MVKEILMLSDGDATIEVYNDLCLCNGQTVQATPNYRQAGPWYDLVNVVWEDTEPDIPIMYLPARVLAFVRKEGNDTEVDEGKYALIHSVEKKDLVKNMSLLTTQYNMEYHQGNSGKPKLTLIDI
eukprot:155692-Ditylum_brightwellii.AAC.1